MTDALPASPVRYLDCSHCGSTTTEASRDHVRCLDCGATWTVPPTVVEQVTQERRKHGGGPRIVTAAGRVY